MTTMANVPIDSDIFQEKKEKNERRCQLPTISGERIKHY